MLHYAVIFFVIAIIAAVLGFSGIAGAASNIAWILFFTGLAALNVLIAYNFSEEIWVNFKLFGSLGLTVLFVIGQALWFSRHIQEEA